MEEKNKLEQQLRKINETRAYRLKNEKYRYYVPIGKTEEFINNVASGKYLISLYSAANGIGKSVFGVNFIANLIWPCGNPYFNQDLLKNWPFPKVIRIVSNPTVIIDNIIPKMKEYFPKGRYGVAKYETTKEGKKYESKWETDNGWIISLMTYEQAVEEFEGATLGLFWCDEPPPYLIYKALIARLREGGIGIITATPLTGSAWMYDEIISNPNNEAGYRSYVEADVESACVEHGVRGFLQHDNILKMIAQYDQDDMQARVFGKFQHLVGLVYKNFDNGIHVIKPFEVSPKDFIVVEAFDYHPRVPDAISFVAIDRQGVHYIVDELFESLEIEELVRRIRDKENQYRIVKRILDPSAFVENQHEMAHKNSFAKILSLNGLSYVPASKRRTEAIKLTRSKLNFQRKDGFMIRPPMLYVFETCTKTIHEFTHWQWDNWRGKNAENKSLKEKPMDKDDHMMENIGRVLLENIQFYEIEKPANIQQRNYEAQQQVTSLDPY